MDGQYIKGYVSEITDQTSVLNNGIVQTGNRNKHTVKGIMSHRDIAYNKTKDTFSE